MVNSTKALPSKKTLSTVKTFLHLSAGFTFKGVSAFPRSQAHSLRSSFSRDSRKYVHFSQVILYPSAFWFACQPSKVRCYPCKCRKIRKYVPAMWIKNPWSLCNCLKFNHPPIDALSSSCTQRSLLLVSSNLAYVINLRIIVSVTQTTKPTHAAGIFGGGLIFLHAICRPRYWNMVIYWWRTCHACFVSRLDVRPSSENVNTVPAMYCCSSFHF